MTRRTNQSTMMFAVAAFVFACAAAACSDATLMAPSPTSIASPASQISTMTGQVTDRAATPVGIAGATVTVQSGRIMGPTTVTDESGFYSMAGIKLAYVTVSVKAEHYVDRSESFDVVDKATRMDFHLMPASEN